MRKARFLLPFLLIPALQTIFAAPGTITWYKFNKKFVTDHFASDSAIGMITATNWKAAATVHSIRCGGDDGELHIGLPEAGIQFDGSHPISALAASDGTDPRWGVVAELPNASEDGPDELDTLEGTQVTFSGYYRLWDEGHAHGQDGVTNPHHVLELHPGIRG
jgi:hypothetical protein